MAGKSTISEECELKIKEDCDKLYAVLKNCENHTCEHEEDDLKSLHCIAVLLRQRQGSKTMSLSLTITAIAYLCNHSILPVILMEIIKESQNLKVCTLVVDILAKLTLKNTQVPENERKSIRKGFHDPHHFKTVLDAFQSLDAHFQDAEKTNASFYEMQVRFLKIINCLYSRKGQAQISLLTDTTIEFVILHFTKYKMHREISKTMLPLIKTLCRSRKYCILICTEPFLSALVAVVPAANRFPAAISILRFMSRSMEAVIEMSRHEKLLHFVISTAICHSEKSTNKKYLMIVLYKITKTSYGAHLISKNYLWLLLLEFFMKSERQFEDLRHRLAYTKACTILHRGVRVHRIEIAPVQLHFNFANDVQKCLSEHRNRPHAVNDNEDSDNEEDGKNSSNELEERLKRSISDLEQNQDEEIDDNCDDDLREDEEDVNEDESENEYHSEDDYKDNDNFVNNDVINNNEFYSEQTNSEFSQRPSTGFAFRSVFRHHVYDRLALPDMLEVGSDVQDCDSTLTASCNAIEEMARKMRQLKGVGREGEFARRCVYDLDALIETEHANPKQIDVPHSLEEVRAKCAAFGVGGSARKMGLAFESRFECGNLRKAEQIGEYEYELWLSPDINVTSGLQWFYFQVSNMIANKTYTFNISNYPRANSQFNYGMQPVVFSSLGYIQNQNGWKKSGEKLIYYGNQYVNKSADKQFRTLRFSLSFPYTGDYCYIAYHFPYTYTRLMNKLRLYTSPAAHIYSRLDKLTQTLNGSNDVPLLTITARESKCGKANEISMERRPLVFLSARVHPGESNASWIMDGILDFLLVSEDARASRAREKYVFKIIPMLNPEGVIYGKCGLTGHDLNRCWKHPHALLHPEIFAAKKLVEFATQRLHRDVLTFTDIHGHSRKKFFFFYGCNPAQSWNEQDRQRSHAPNFNMMADAFSADPRMKMSFCRNTIDRKREATCRVVMWREFAINSYTLECSFCSTENKKKITTQMLQDIGRSVITALSEMTAQVNQNRNLGGECNE